MATKTFEELKQLAIQIRDEKTNKANTATRIGTQMIEHLNKLEQEYYNKDGVAEQLKTRDDELARLDKMTTEYNVSVLHPTSGSGGSNKYTLETAIAQVPSKYRSVGLKCSFINSSGKPECWKYQGSSWAVGNFIPVEVTNELNISFLYPANGEGGTNKYTLAGAIAQVPSEYRTVVGLKITFISNDTSKPETWKYNGGTFTTSTNWVQGDGSGGNLILAWNTDVATTRKQVLSQERKSLLQISYKNADGDIINEQYIGTSFTDTEWVKDSNWEKIPNQEIISKLNADISKNLSYNTQMTPFFIDEKASYCLNKKGDVFKPTYGVNMYNGYKSYKVEGGQRIFIKKTNNAGGLNVVFTDINNIVLDDEIFSLSASNSLLKGAYMIVPQNAVYMHIFAGIEELYLLSNNSNIYNLLSRKGVVGQNNIICSYPILRLDGSYFNIQGPLCSGEIDTSYYKKLYLNGGYTAGADIVPVIGLLDDSYVKIEAKTKNGTYEYYEIPNNVNTIRVNLSTHSTFAFITDENFSNLNDEEIEYITESRREIFGINENSLDFKKLNITGNSSEFDTATKTIRFIGTGNLMVTAVMNEIVSFDTETKAWAIWIGKLKLVSIEDEADSVYLTSNFDYKGDKGTIFKVGDTKTVITYTGADNLIYCTLTADKQSTFEVVEGQSFYISGALYKSLLPNTKFNALKNALTRHLNKDIKGQSDIAYSYAVDMHEGYDRIVAFGDSVTANDMSWLYIVAKKLNLPYLNLAVSGSGPSYNSNLSPDNLAKIPSDTGIVVITGGWNGHVEGDNFHPEDYNYEEDKDDVNTAFGGVCNAINYIRTNHPMARIVLATPAKGATSLSVQPWCYIFSTIAEKQNIVLADVDKYGDWEYIGHEAFSDGVHPNSNGSNRIAAIILDAIRRIIC